MDTTTQNTPQHLIDKAAAATLNLLPEKSRLKYLNMYDKFVAWKESEKATSWSEEVLLSYFVDQAAKYAPSTLWANYSMLKSTISSKHNIDISQYLRLQAFLKKQSTGFQSKKSKVFSPGEINKFIREASDEKFLFEKVGAILGVLGACRRKELCDLTVKNFKKYGKKLLKIDLNDTKTHEDRSFTIEGEFFKIVKNYISLRPKNFECDRFFLHYQNNRCTWQVVGKNTIADCPKRIATFLNLPNAEKYTGHSFRRTSVTILADSGADITTIKRHGGWKSTPVDEGYIQNSINNKRKICNQLSSIIDQSSTSSSIQPVAPEEKLRMKNEQETSNPVTYHAQVLPSPGSSKLDTANPETSTTITSKQINYHFHNCTINTMNF